MPVVPFARLTTDQQKIVEEASKRGSSLLVEGPPGSGKTLISLHIIKMMKDEQVVRPLVLMFNHSLRGFTQKMLEELGVGEEATVNTKDAFFWSLRRSYNIHVSDGPSYEIKYGQILSSLQAATITERYSVIILDEVQDFLPPEWEILKRMSDSFILLGDFNQRIFKSQLSRTEIAKSKLTRRLTQIFRFGTQIATFVEKFSATKDVLTKMVTNHTNQSPVVLDFENYEKAIETLAELVRLRQKEGSVAIISPEKTGLDFINHRLQSKGIASFLAPNNKDYLKYDFSSSVPLLITAHSAKGLEFQTVILFGFDTNSRTLSESRKSGKLGNLLYVALSRTIQNLIVFRTDSPKSIPELYELPTETNAALEEDEGWF